MMMEQESTYIYGERFIQAVFMKEYLSTCFTLLLMIVCLPFLATFLISGQESCPLYKPLDMEKYLPVIVYLQIPYTHHLENIKAQTVIARTNIQRQLEKGASLYEILEEPLDYLVHEQSVFHFLRTYEQFVKAAGATRGQILTYQNQKVVLPYCYMTAGGTRDGTSLFHSDAYEYLVSVDSSADQKSEDYLTSTYFPDADYYEQVEIVSCDKYGYVQFLKAGGHMMSGEEFRRKLELPSSAFTLQEINGQTRILCRGHGHGLGFSQYGGNKMAQQGKHYKEILKYYFPRLDFL